MLKQFIPILSNSPAFEKFISLLEQSGGRRANLLRVLTYHRVDEPDARTWFDPGLISATPDMFESQMKYLAANYEPVSARDVIQSFESGSRIALPPRAVLITFDDAYSDFEKHAWPVLNHYKIPSILFVPTAFPEHPEKHFWWDSLYHAIHATSLPELRSALGSFPITTIARRHQAYKSLKNHFKTVPHEEAMAEVDRICRELDVPPQANDILNWESLRRLAGNGVALGAHTRNHPIMNCITLEELQNEVLGSLQDLTREIGSTPLTFAYPSGIHNDDAISVVRQAGFKLAFTTERGLNNVSRADRLRLKRINVGGRTTLPILRAQLLSWSAPLYSWAHRISG